MGRGIGIGELMPITSIGIVIGENRRNNAENAAVSVLRNSLGAKLSGLWLGSDLIGDSVALQWPGRVGGTLTNFLPGRFDLGVANGKKCIDHLGTSVAALTCDISLTQEVWVVASPTALPFSGYRMCLGTSIAGTPGRYLQADRNTSNWYLNGLTTIFKNGSASNVVDGGLAVYTSRAVYTGGASRLYVGSDPQLTSDLTRVWRGKITAIMILGSTSTTEQLTTCTAALKSLYRIA